MSRGHVTVVEASNAGVNKNLDFGGEIKWRHASDNVSSRALHVVSAQRTDVTYLKSLGKGSCIDALIATDNNNDDAFVSAKDNRLANMTHRNAQRGSCLLRCGGSRWKKAHLRFRTLLGKELLDALCPFGKLFVHHNLGRLYATRDVSLRTQRFATCAAPRRLARKTSGREAIQADLL
jgi:hypothetical protein